MLYCILAHYVAESNDMYFKPAIYEGSEYDNEAMSFEQMATAISLLHHWTDDAYPNRWRTGEDVVIRRSEID